MRFISADIVSFPRFLWDFSKLFILQFYRWKLYFLTLLYFALLSKHFQTNSYKENRDVRNIHTDVEVCYALTMKIMPSI